MPRLELNLLVISLAALTACTIDKGGDDSTGASETSAATTTGDDPTGSTTAGPTGSPTGDPTGSPTGDPTGSPTSATTGDPTGDLTTGTTGDTGEGNAPCIDTATVLAVDEAAALGFSAADLLSGKLGARTGSLTFAEEPLSLSDAWKGEVLPLTFELRHEGGEVRFIDSEVNPDYDDSGNESGFQECTDRLEIDVKFDFVTEAGEFDEHHDAVLTATTVERADLQVELLPPGPSGSFDASTLYSDPEWVVTRLLVSAAWQAELAGGSLLNEVIVGGDEGFAGFGGVAGYGDPGLTF